jgi:hypothetical protein
MYIDIYIGQIKRVVGNLSGLGKKMERRLSTD